VEKDQEAGDEILNIIKGIDFDANTNKQAKVKALEEEIDQLVYKLYDLTQEEIKIVEEENR
jgi:adenine-specific DNA-methyltransferase